MKKQKQNSLCLKPKNTIFGYLLLLTFFFILIEISLYIQTSEFSLSDLKEASLQFVFPMIMLPSLLFFAAVQVGAHSLFLYITWVITKGLANFLFVKEYLLRVGLFIWCYSLVLILLVNQYFYPYSRFSLLMSLFISHIAAGYLLLLLFVIYIFIISFALYGLLKARSFQLIVISLIAITLIFFSYDKTNEYHFPNALHKPLSLKPNIIIIGIDSLRPDFIHFFGGEQATPFLDRWLKQSTVFSDTLTPLARTFPSWMSILTGEYPQHTGFITNLANQQHALFTKSLPYLLQKQGYETVFATDETRFSNITKRMGFDQLITPPTGLADFLLGTLNDFPLTNFWVNTTLGSQVFPFSYGNRPVYHTYDPQSFLNKVKPLLNTAREKPLFLAIHFCLPHSPYIWANAPLLNENNPVKAYSSSVERVDQQVGDFFTLLHQAHLLHNAIVVLLSDHGEALAFEGDRILHPSLSVSGALPNNSIPYFTATHAINESAGHGTDVLSLSQNHTLLAFKLYGDIKQAKKTVPGLVSLLDIKPTILDLLKLPLSIGDGLSLAAVIQHKNEILPTKSHFFIETDFSPIAIRSVFPNIQEALLQGLKLFTADSKTALLSVKPEKLHLIVDTKQYADISGKWMLSLYPQTNKRYLPILVDLETGLWSWQLNTPLAAQSPAHHMLSALETFYGRTFPLMTRPNDYIK